MTIFNVVCVLMLALPMATLVLRGKYVSTNSKASQAMLVGTILASLAAFDGQSILWLITSVVLFAMYVRRLVTYLEARKISERYGAPCPKHREA